MPKSTIDSGGRARFYVSTPMSWQAAQQFCEQYGGNLAVFPEPSDLQEFVGHMELGQSVWIGAGEAWK